MLRQLRLKFVCINMVLFTAMLCIVLGLVVHFTRVGLERDSLRMMQTAASRPFAPGLPDRGREFQGSDLPCFTVRITREGQMFASGTGYREMSEEELRTLVSTALAEEEPSGVLTSYQLRYLRTEGPERCLVFAEIYQERAALAQLARTCVLLGCVGFAALLVISFFLAWWAVRPVERAWEQQRQFVADASHELKTPLTVILTDAELLQNQSAGPLAGGILTMARQMRGLVEDLLDLARADSGRTEPFAPVDLSALVSEAALPFEALFFERGLTLTEAVEEGIVVSGSGGRLRQAVDIFLDNAQKYAAPGEVVLRLERKGRSRCVLSVSSPGEPIPKAELGNLFKRFYRLDKARSRDGSYGLGLSIVQSIAEAHRGRTWAESSPAGNVFLLELNVLTGTGSENRRDA